MDKGKLLNYLKWILSSLTVGAGIGTIWGGCAALPYVLILLGIFGIAVSVLSEYKFEKLKDISYDFKNTKIVWGLWNTGTEVMNKGLAESETIQRVLLPQPSVGNKAVVIHSQIGNQRTPKEEVDDIKRLKRIIGKKVRYLSKPFTYTLTFFDKKPEGNRPCSKKAWLLIQIHEPVSANKRHSIIIKNKGKTKESFEAFIKLYERLWDESEEGEPSV